MWKYSFKAWVLSLIFYPVRLWSVAGAGVLNKLFFSVFVITAFTLVNSWILEYLEASSVAWLMSTICFSWKVVSIMSEHTCTDQQVIFWVTTAQWTLDTNWSWQTASGVLGSAKCGGACEFLLCLSLYMRERREISKKHRERERRGERVRNEGSK